MKLVEAQVVNGLVVSCEAVLAAQKEAATQRVVMFTVVDAFGHSTSLTLSLVCAATLVHELSASTREHILDVTNLAI